jgi:hypothetical protein
VDWSPIWKSTNSIMRKLCRLFDYGGRCSLDFKPSSNKWASWNSFSEFFELRQISHEQVSSAELCKIETNFVWNAARCRYSFCNRYINCLPSS